MPLVLADEIWAYSKVTFSLLPSLSLALALAHTHTHTQLFKYFLPLKRTVTAKGETMRGIYLTFQLLSILNPRLKPVPRSKSQNKQMSVGMI